MQSPNNIPYQQNAARTNTARFYNTQNNRGNINNNNKNVVVDVNKPRLVSAPEVNAYLKTVDELHISDEEIVKCVKKFMRTMRKAGWKNHEGRKITNWKARVKGYALTWQKNVDAAKTPVPEETNL